MYSYCFQQESQSALPQTKVLVFVARLLQTAHLHNLMTASVRVADPGWVHCQYCLLQTTALIAVLPVCKAKHAPPCTPLLKFLRYIFSFSFADIHT